MHTADLVAMIKSSLFKKFIDTFLILQALQVVSVDVTTVCHLGICIAVRATEAVPLVNSGDNRKSGEEGIFTNMQVESALRISGLGKHSKHSKQRFLRMNCRDSVINASRKGAGGNTTPYSCFIVKQCGLFDGMIDLLRQGTI